MLLPYLVEETEQRELHQLLASVRISRVPPERVRHGLPEFLATDPLCRGRIVELREGPVVFVRVAKSLGRKAKVEMPRRILAWGWEESLGGILSICVGMGSEPSSTVRVMLPFDEEPVGLVRDAEELVVGLVSGGSVVAAFRASTPSSARAKLWGEHVDRLDAHRASLSLPGPAMFLSLPRTMSEEAVASCLSSSERLQVGWAMEVEHAISKMRCELKECRAQYGRGRQPRASRTLVGVLDIAVASSWDLAETLSEVERELAPVSAAFVKNFFLRSEEGDEALRPGFSWSEEMDEAFFGFVTAFHRYRSSSWPVVSAGASATIP